MKIQILTYSISRLAGGVLDAVKDLFTNKVFKDIDISLFSYYDAYSNEDLHLWGKIKIILFKPHIFLYSRDLKCSLLKSDANILHMEGLWRYPTLLISLWITRQKKPLICSPHGMLDPYIIKHQGMIKRLFAKLFFDKKLNKVTCFHALCQKELEDIRSYGIKCPVAIIPNGVYLPDIDVVSQKKDCKKHLLFLGRLHPKKGVDILLKAIKKLLSINPDKMLLWKVDIVGWGDTEYRNLLEQICKDSKLNDIVTFYGGVYGEKKSMMYANADAYILPSHGEGLPMSVLEAWSYGLPVIMTPQCNITEGFDAGAAIRIKDDITGIVDGLQHLLSLNDNDRKKMGENGRKLVEQKFSWTESAKKMLLVYQWLLGEGEKPEFVFD